MRAPPLLHRNSSELSQAAVQVQVGGRTSVVQRCQNSTGTCRKTSPPVPATNLNPPQSCLTFPTVPTVHDLSNARPAARGMESLPPNFRTAAELEHKGEGGQRVPRILTIVSRLLRGKYTSEASEFLRANDVRQNRAKDRAPAPLSLYFRRPHRLPFHKQLPPAPLPIFQLHFTQ